MSFVLFITRTQWFVCSLGLADLDWCSKMEVPTRSQSAPGVPAEWCLEHVCTSPGSFGGEASLALLEVDPRRTHRHTVQFSVASSDHWISNPGIADRVQRVSETFFLRISVNVLQQLKCSQEFFRSTFVTRFFSLFSMKHQKCPLRARSLLVR